MAALNYHSSTTTLYRRLTTGPTKPILPISCVSASFPSKPTRRRKNHLRIKILKTLSKPIVPKNPNTQIDSQPSHEVKEPENVVEVQEFENSGVEKVEELSEVGVLADSGGSVGVLGKGSILKYGLWLVGAFVFQNVCAVFVFGGDDKSGSEKSSVLEVVGDGKGKSRLKILVNGKMRVGGRGVESVVYVDELEMERKIEEIRAMAREAREKERLDSKKGSFDGEEGDGGKYSKSGIEDEVDTRLVKLRKKLENAREKMPVALVGYPKEDSQRKVDGGEGNGALLFKKKYKFKDLSGDPVEKPKGFIGKDDSSSKKSKESGKSKNEDDAVHVEEEDSEKQKADATQSTKYARKHEAKEKGTRKIGKGKGEAKPKLERNNRRPSKLTAEAMKSIESIALEGKDVEDDFWWSGLPYAFGIFMQRGHDGELGEGLYTLKSISSTEKRISHSVAFEDRVDATNFCYLLQSFFEDLDDFKADVVPLSVKELNEAVKAQAMRVIVVKKGQLRLYAGQPLAEAEMELRAMIKQG